MEADRAVIHFPIWRVVGNRDHLGLTLVHVNRTLRRIREERIAIVDRGVVMILDLDRLRAVARGLPEPAEIPEEGDPPSDEMHSAASTISSEASVDGRRNVV